MRGSSEPSTSTIWVAGKPKPKERPRFSRNGHSYTPKGTQDYESLVRQAWVDGGGELLEGPCAITMDFTVDGCMVNVTPVDWMSKMRGDLDNYSKAIADGLQGVAYLNDKQIVRMTAEKR